jgi:hypothetical protein
LGFTAITGVAAGATQGRAAANSRNSTSTGGSTRSRFAHGTTVLRFFDALSIPLDVAAVGIVVADAFLDRALVTSRRTVHLATAGITGGPTAAACIEAARPRSTTRGRCAAHADFAAGSATFGRIGADFIPLRVAAVGIAVADAGFHNENLATPSGVPNAAITADNAAHAARGDHAARVDDAARVDIATRVDITARSVGATAVVTTDARFIANGATNILRIGGADFVPQCGAAVFVLIADAVGDIRVVATWTGAHVTTAVPWSATADADCSSDRAESTTDTKASSADVSRTADAESSTSAARCSRVVDPTSRACSVEQQLILTCARTAT